MITRNSQIVFIETSGTRTALPWINNAPDFTGIEEPTLSVLQKAWNDFLESGEELEVISASEIMPVIANPDWEGLKNRGIAGDLHSIFARLTAETITNPSLAVPRSDINLIITVTKDEPTLASGLVLLQQFGFVFAEKEKQLWNNALQELGFSAIAQIQ
jgi:hypothetical protein